jgi:malonyl-CoA/methylmalonyl-CoA synthetase
MDVRLLTRTIPAPSQPVKEALYYAQKSRATAVIASSSAFKLGKELEKAANEAGQNLPCVLARDSIFNTPLAPSDILISSDRYLDSNGASLVIFTSGTTGPPKGVVQRRVLVDDGSLWCAQQMELDSSDVLLHLLPVHHATGIEVSFFPFLFSGACIEFRSGSFDPEWTWNRWAKGDITFFSGVPTIYTRMMRYYHQNLSKRPAGELARYVAGARRFKGAICGTSALPHSISDFWTELFGKKIVQRYGSTESCVVFNMPMGAASATVPDGSVGKVSWGVDVKLSEGDEGEVLIKSPFLFAKYLHDPKATADALNDQGYYKSGDIARKEGEYYWIMGRASVDILKSGGYKISALDIEREILALPYVSEVMVVGVPDDEFGQRVGAVVSLQTDNLDAEWSKSHGSPSFVLTLAALRSDLSSRLAGYKRPTLLRVITHEFPRTPSGKVVKKLLGPQYFPQNYETIPEVQSWKAPSSGPRARL